MAPRDGTHHSMYNTISPEPWLHYPFVCGSNRYSTSKAHSSSAGASTSRLQQELPWLTGLTGKTGYLVGLQRYCSSFIPCVVWCLRMVR